MSENEKKIRLADGSEVAIPTSAPWANVPDNARVAAGLRQSAAHGDINEEVEEAAIAAEDVAGAVFQQNLGVPADIMQAGLQAAMQLGLADAQARRQARMETRKVSSARLLADALDLARESLMYLTENDGGVRG